MEEYKTANLDVNTFFEMTDLIGTISNNPEDYASFIIIIRESVIVMIRCITCLATI